jgi:nucleotide-binding universal stress UspA family protein
MPGPIVVGYDGTEGAQAALAEALRLAGALDAEVVVAFAYWVNPLGGEMADFSATLRERGETLLVEALETARSAGVAARAELLDQRPAEGLADLAAATGAQMIAVGTHGEAPLRAVIVGSTPHKLMHLSEVPVLVTRQAAGPAP